MGDSKQESIIALLSSVHSDAGLVSTNELESRSEPPSKPPLAIKTTGYDSVLAGHYCVDYDSSQRIRNMAHRIDIKKNIAHHYPYLSEHDARKAYTAYVNAFIEARRLQREWNRKGQPVPRDERRRVYEKLAQAMDVVGVPTVK